MVYCYAINLIRMLALLILCPIQSTEFKVMFCI